MKNSDRLIYRLIDKDDFDFYYALNTSEQVMRYAYIDAFNTENEAKSAFDKVMSEQKDHDFGEQYVVIKKDTMEKIGIADFEIKEDKRICEIGYFILPEYWGNGYAAEMGRALVNYLFSLDKADKIIASCHCENKASEKTMIKIGMNNRQLNENGRYKNGRFSDEIRYSISKSEWER